MGKIMEMFGFKSGAEKVARINDEKYLNKLLDSYKTAFYSKMNIPQAALGMDHQVDVSGLANQEYAIETLPKKILELAEKLGLDGNSLISDAEEEARQMLEKSKAA